MFTLVAGRSRLEAPEQDDYLQADIRAMVEGLAYAIAGDSRPGIRIGTLDIGYGAQLQAEGEPTLSLS
jgi:hypothetical protein